MKIETLQGLTPDNEAIDAIVNNYKQYEAGIDQLAGLGALSESETRKQLISLGKTQLNIAINEYHKNPNDFHAIGYDSHYWQLAQEVLDEFENGTLEGISIKLDEASKYEDAIINSDNSAIAQAMNGFDSSPRNIRRKRQRDIDAGKYVALEGWFSKIGRSIKRRVKKVSNSVRSAGRSIRKVARSTGRSIRYGVRNTGRGIRKVAKNTGKAIHKGVKVIGKVLAKINPVFMLIRTGMLLAVRNNWQGLASGMGFGILTKSTAVKANLDLHEWQKSVQAYNKFASKYRFFGGRESVLKSTLSKAWRKTVAGKYQNLGSADGKGGIAAAAMKILKPIIDWIKKNVNFKKLIKKVKEKTKERLEKEINDPNVSADKKEKLNKRLTRVNNTLVLLNKEEKAQTEKIQSNIDNTQVPSVSIAESSTKQAGMNPLLIGGLILVAGGLLLSKNKKNNEKEKKDVKK